MSEDYVPFDNDSMGGVGDYLKLQQLYDETEQLIDELREYEYEAADKEGNYRMLVTAKTAELRMNNVPVTIVGNLVKGDSEVVQAFLAMERAKSNAKATSHLIFLKKDKMGMIAELIKHEWYRPSNA